MPPVSIPIGGISRSFVNERDDLAERGADHDADRHVDDVAAHREFFEFLDHSHGDLPSCGSVRTLSDPLRGSVEMT